MDSIAHNLAVAKVIDDVITLMNAKTAKSGVFNIAQLLELCRGYVVTNLRESGKPGASENTVFRDAEYYFIGRMEVAEETNDVMRFVESERWVMVNQGYNALKSLSVKFKKSKIMRTDPTKPNSPPGGGEWLKAGITDGWSDKGTEFGAILPRMSVAEFEGARDALPPTLP